MYCRSVWAEIFVGDFNAALRFCATIRGSENEGKGDFLGPRKREKIDPEAFIMYTLFMFVERGEFRPSVPPSQHAGF